MRWLITWLRTLAAFAIVSFAAVSARTGCAGKDYNPATDPLPQRTMAWMKRHEAKVHEAKQRAGKVDLLFVGDSITQSYELDGPEDYLKIQPVWDELFAPHRAMNLGFNGDRTSQVLWRLEHGEVVGLAPKDIVLLIGANSLNPSGVHPQGDSAERIADGSMAVVEELHRRMPEARILVLSILPSNYSAERTARSNAVNAAVRARTSNLNYARYLDVGPLFLDGSRLRSELFFDPLLSPGATPQHPTATGQRMMAEAVAKALYGQ